MKICFLLPEYKKVPSGGYKMVFEYANRLQKNGYEVSIAFDCRNSVTRKGIPSFLRNIIRKKRTQYHPKWFTLSTSIKKICVLDDNFDNYIPDGNTVVATAVQTAKPVFELPESKGEKVYFIQDFENWGLTKEAVYETYRYGMNNIVISSWLKGIVDLYSVSPSVLIPNGIDLDIFGIDNLIENRNPHSIAMLFHLSEHKGSKYGLAVLEKIKKLYPDVKVQLFGTPKRPDDMPSWIEYTQSATPAQLRNIYNESAVFLCSSVKEGFGLTGAESVACGCALVSTSYDAVYEYADDNHNALLSPPKDVDAQVVNIDKLFKDDDLRISLAKQASEDIKKLSWGEAIKKFILELES